MPSSPRRCRGPLVLLLLLGAAGLAHGAHVRAATARPGGADPYAHHKVKRYYQSWHDPTAPFALAETAASAGLSLFHDTSHCADPRQHALARPDHRTHPLAATHAATTAA